MNETYSLSADLRATVGTSAGRRLRLAGNVPAVIYGLGQASQSISLSHRVFEQLLSKLPGYSAVIQLQVGDKTEAVLLKAVQRHPYRKMIIHADFQRIDAGQRVQVSVPLRFVGAQNAPGVKIGKGIVNYLSMEVEILCLPKDLPSAIEVDLSHLEIEQTLHLSDLTFPSGVVCVALAQGVEHDRPVASVHSVALDSSESAQSN